MGFPINDPTAIIIERQTKDRVASYKAKKQMNVRNMDSVLNILMDFYDEAQKKNRRRLKGGF